MVKVCKSYQRVSIDSRRRQDCRLYFWWKDSMLLAKCMQELYRHGQFHFEVEYIVMDPGYTEKHRKEIEENAKILNIPIRIFETNIFDSVFHITEEVLVTCAPECVVVICILMHKVWDVIRLPWVIIMMMC